MRVLYVEDSERLRRSVSDGLRRSGYTVDTAADGEDGLHLASTEKFDVIILDIMLPKLSGLEVLRELRSAGNPVHVLLLTARETVPDRVLGLRAGADDYLPKPFAFDELLARVEALARRQNRVKSNTVKVGALSIDLSAKTVRQNGTLVDLPPREYGLLEFLVLRRGQVVSRTEIEDHLYDSNAERMSNVVDSAVCALRRKMGRDESSPLIQTRRGLGYILVDEHA